MDRHRGAFFGDGTDLADLTAGFFAVFEGLLGFWVSKNLSPRQVCAKQ
jgi:hypothetical protein